MTNSTNMVSQYEPGTWPFPSAERRAEQEAYAMLARRLEVAQRLADALRVVRADLADMLMSDYVTRRTPDPVANRTSVLAADAVLTEWEALKP